MEIIRLMERQQALEAELVVMKRQFPLRDKEACLRYAAVQKYLKEIESQICSFAQEIVDDPTLDYCSVVETFAQELNVVAVNGGSLRM